MKRAGSATINDTNTSSESESDGSERVEKTREKAKQNPAKKKKYVQKFLVSWLTDVQFKDWLEKRGEVPYCKYCQCSLSCAKTALVRHKENKKHRSLCGIKEKSQSITYITAILGVFFNEQEFRLEIILIDLVPLPNGTANTIYNTLIGNLKEKGIPMKNIIGFCADTCNVMFGIHHSVAQLLVRDYPWIIAIKCSCHLIHLCSSYASKMLPKSVEDLCRNIFSHFNMSSKRTESFKEFQQFVELKELKILRPGKIFCILIILSLKNRFQASWISLIERVDIIKTFK